MAFMSIKLKHINTVIMAMAVQGHGLDEYQTKTYLKTVILSMDMQGHGLSEYQTKTYKNCNIVN